MLTIDDGSGQLGVKEAMPFDPSAFDPEAEQEEVFQALYDIPEDGDGGKEEILKEQNERYKASCEWMNQLLPGMIKNYKRYRSIAEPLRDNLGRELTNRSNIYVPYPWAIVESAMPRLAGRLPRVHAFPRKRVEQTKVDAIQDLILYSLDRMEFLKLQQNWIRQFEIYGWSPLVYFWKHEERPVFDRVDGPSGRVMRKIKKTIWDDFGAKVLDVFDCFPQPGVEEIDKGDWFLYRDFLSKKDIKALVEGEVFYPEVLEYLKDNPNPGRSNMAANDSREDRDDLTGLPKDSNRHSFGKYEVRYTLEATRIVVTIDGKIVARVGDNPNPLQELSVINLNLLQMINEPIGISSIEALGGLPDKLNMLTNARLDSIALSIHKPFMANRMSNTDFDNIIMAPGNIILTDDMDSIKALEVPDVSQSSAQEIMTTKEEMQFTSGISDYIVGVKSGARLSDTATGVSSIIRESNAKFALKLATFESYPLRKLVEMIHTYNMLYMPEEKRIHVLGPKGYVVKDVKLDDILVESDFIIEPGSSVPLDQQSRRESLTALLDRILQMPQVVDINKYMREVLEAYDIRNPEDFLLQANMNVPEAEDAELAEAENIALLQGQEIELKGNPQLHIAIHSRAVQEATDPQQQMAITAHLKLHMAQVQQQMAAMQQQAGPTIFGGGGAPPAGLTIFGQGGNNGQQGTNSRPLDSGGSSSPAGGGGDAGVESTPQLG